MLSVKAAAPRDRGRGRDYNEDAFVVEEALQLFVVSDGIGGAVAGERASAAVAQVLPAQLRTALAGPVASDLEAVSSVLSNAITELSQQLHSMSSQYADLHGMGATVVACIVREGAAIVAHMGDSRAYLVRQGCLTQLTQDHTLADLLKELGQLPADQDEVEREKHILTRYVGMEGRVSPDVRSLDVRTGDLFVLCTDGLTSVLSDAEIGELAQQRPDLGEACDAMVAAANEAGGPDNITVMLVQCGEHPSSLRSGGPQAEGDATPGPTEGDEP